MDRDWRPSGRTVKSASVEEGIAIAATSTPEGERPPPNQGRQDSLLSNRRAIAPLDFITLMIQRIHGLNRFVFMFATRNETQHFS